MNWSELDRMHPILRQLRRQRFELPPNELQGLVERLFEPIEYMSSEEVGGVELNLSSFTVEWAWNSYWSATTQREVELVVAGWVPLLSIARHIRGKP